MLKYVLFFLLASCGPNLEPVNVKELKVEFENIWWEMTEHQPWEEKGYIYCYYFDSEYDEVKPPNDGGIFYHEEDGDTYLLSPFQRITGGYYITKYDIDFEVYVDEYGNYSVKASRGILTNKSDIIPCSLDL